MIASALALALGTVGCAGITHTTSTSPSATGVAALMGSWVSAPSGVIPPASSCSDFKWNATEQTANSAKGSFSATCAGNLKVAGTAQGTLNGSVIAWSAEGDATTAGIACHIVLTGTAELGVDSIRVPYSGDTCVGKVSGVEILNKK